MIKKLRFEGKNRDKVFAHIDRLNSSGMSAGMAKNISAITEEVRREGDRAVNKYTEKFDGVRVHTLQVPVREIKKAYGRVDRAMLKPLGAAIANITRFHEMQRRNIKGYVFRGTGYTITQKYLPVESAGLYIPGGQAPLFSTVVMAGIPAKTAGVKRIAVVSPPRYGGEVNPYILVAADMIGIKEVYRAGGPHAIAALAYGTKSIPRVDKIAGPGNVFSTTAKKLLFGEAGIDMINGPSEVTVVADSSAKPKFLALDLLAQAEHVNGHSMLVTDSKKLIAETEREIKNAGTRIKVNITVIMVKNMKEALEVVNRKAPEHLTVMTRNSAGFIKGVANAPAIFEGNYSPVAFGDYIAGANHILPTNGSSRFFSALSVLDFLKHTHIVKAGMRAMKSPGKMAEKMAEIETLHYHMMSIRERRKGS